MDSRRIPIYTSDATRVAGVVESDTFTTLRRASVHMLRVPPAWSFDRDVLLRARQRGATRVIVREVEQNNIYEAPLDDVLLGIPVSRGHGEQVALPLARWRINNARSEYEREREQRELKSAQLALFALEVLP